MGRIGTRVILFSKCAIWGAAFAVCVAALLGVPALYGQSAASQGFEVATVKPSNGDPSTPSGISTGHGRLDARYVTLKRCIMGAYGVGPHEVSGGPEWVAADRYDILAKADQPVDSDAALMVMLQALMAERFKLAMHRETRTISALVLEVDKKGSKLEKVEAGEAVTNTSTSETGVTIDARFTDMDAFARILARKMDLPVVNRTGLQGVYNLKLHWTPESARGSNGDADEASIFTALQEQLGLRLRAEKAPVEVLVIDHVERPSEN